jgi:signal transduction histidine kinase
MNRKKTIMIYEPEKGYIKIETMIENGSVWLTQNQIALAFGTQRPAITKHLDHIFRTGELKESSVSSKIELTAKDGKKYMVKIYNLDVIISVGYRVNSKKATQFRMWATNVLKKHIEDGYSIDEARLLESSGKLKELQNRITEIQEANGELKKINHLKNEYISLATHQIRGPLGAIKGYISLILEGDYGKVPKEFVEPLDIIFKSTDSLSKTVSDFLDISRIEQGEMKYYLKDFNVVDLINEVVNEFKINVEKSGLQLKTNIIKGEFILHEDKTKLKQVFANLLDNANKYTKSGWIEVGLSKKDDNKLIFSVKDSGVGISKETLPLLFKKFSRAKDANGANILGTGLGLYVAKKILEIRNNHIWAESEGEGKGSQFYVELNLVNLSQ